MDLVSLDSTKNELSAFLKVYKSEINNVDPQCPKFLKLLRTATELQLGFTGQIWFFLLRSELDQKILPQGTKNELKLFRSFF